MRGLWLWLFPLLYLPNLGFASQTAFGTLEISDFLIGPYIVLVSLGVWRDQCQRSYSRLTPWLIGFVAVTLVSTLTIWLRFPGASDYAMIFGLLKLGKLSLYGVAGVLTARALANPASRERYDWAVLGAGVVVAVALLFMPDEASRFASSSAQVGYRATNAVSVMMAVMLAYLVGRALVQVNGSGWHRAAVWLLPLIALGFMLSKGRGGWVAALVGLAYLFYRFGVRRQVILVLVIGLTTVGVAYTQYPSFKEQVDMTLWPDEAYLARYGAGVAGVDDGARLVTWEHEIKKLPDAPFLGTGFFHRGSVSGLWMTGSHNFWLQMLLETGLLGFGILCVAGWRMWNATREAPAWQLRLRLPVQAAFVTAFVGGLSGEYFYGGMVLFTLLAMYAPVGALPAGVSQTGLVGKPSPAARSPYQTAIS